MFISEAAEDTWDLGGGGAHDYNHTGLSSLAIASVDLTRPCCLSATYTYFQLTFAHREPAWLCEPRCLSDWHQFVASFPGLLCFKFFCLHLKSKNRWGLEMKLTGWCDPVAWVDGLISANNIFHIESSISWDLACKNFKHEVSPLFRVKLCPNSQHGWHLPIFRHKWGASEIRHTINDTPISA